MKSKLTISKFLVLLLSVIGTMVVSINVYAAGEDTQIWCKDVPKTIRFLSPHSSIKERNFTFECDDNCGVLVHFLGTGYQIAGDGVGYTKIYELTFNKLGEHNISVYVDGILNEKLGGKFIIREEHRYGAAKITQRATCTSPGSKKYTCVVCEHSYSDNIPAIGHNYVKTGEFVVTCTKSGRKTYVCSNCHKSKVEYLSATGHSYAKWRVTKKATIFNKGLKTRTCAVCETVEKKPINKLKSSVSISKKTLRIKRGSRYTLKIKKKTTGDKIISWTSSKNKVVSVNKKTGQIKALKNGTSIITLKMKSGCNAKCKVFVY